MCFKNLKLCLLPSKCADLEGRVQSLESEKAILEQEKSSLTQQLNDCNSDLSECQNNIRIVPAPPSQTERITKQEAEQLLRAACGNCGIFLADPYYDITTVTEMRRFIWEDAVYNMQYVAHILDCDDFTRRLKGDLVCEGWSAQIPLDIWFNRPGIGGHSEFLTILLNDEDGSMDKTVYLIEGQLDSADAFELAEEMFIEADLVPNVIKQ